MIQVCVAGVTGWVGEPLAAAIQATDDCALAAAVARRASGETRGAVTVVGSVLEALATPWDVLVDFTSAAAVKENVLAAIGGGRYVVVGSSGLGDRDYDDIDRAATAAGVGVLAVGNFAITAALLQRFAIEAARHLPAWEIIDTAYAGKMDAPSGMARELAWRLSEVRQPALQVPVEQTVGDPSSRGADVNQSRIHSVRLPGYTIGLEVRFGEQDERLTIHYDAGQAPHPTSQARFSRFAAFSSSPASCAGWTGSSERVIAYACSSTFAGRRHMPLRLRRLGRRLPSWECGTRVEYRDSCARPSASHGRSPRDSCVRQEQSFSKLTPAERQAV
jgi:4-hydroxy-tetrahydrodipicolinate reductase